MTAYQAAVIAIRVLAVWTLVLAVGQLSQSLSFGAMTLLDDRGFLLSSAAGLVVLAAVAGLLWFLAPSLAARMAGTATPEAEVVARTWTPERVLTIALIIIGLFLVLYSIVPIVVQVLLWANLTFRDFDITLGRWHYVEYVLRPALEFLLGVLLILGAGFWSRLLLRLRDFGLETKK